MDNYQAIYDAVRSKMGYIDSGVLMDRIVQCFDMYSQISAMFQSIEYENIRPSVVYHPKIYIDGNQWCALYGENLQDGVAGFGESPSKAMQDFDKSWQENLCDQHAKKEFEK